MYLFKKPIPRKSKKQQQKEDRINKLRKLEGKEPIKLPCDYISWELPFERWEPIYKNK